MFKLEEDLQLIILINDQFELHLHICQKSAKLQMLQKNPEYILNNPLPYTYYLNFKVIPIKNVEEMVIVRKFIFLVTAAIFDGRQAVGHSFEREPSEDLFSQAWKNSPSDIIE